MVNIPNSITNYVDNQKPLCNSLCVNNSQHFPPDQFQKHMPLNMNYIHHKKDLLFYVLCHCSWFPLQFDDWKQGIIRKLSYWMKHKNHRSLRDHAMYAPSQWEMYLCNAVSHWLGTYTEWSLPLFTITPLYSVASITLKLYPSAAETKIFMENEFNTMAADALPHCITRLSATTALNMHSKVVLVSS